MQTPLISVGGVFLYKAAAPYEDRQDRRRLRVSKRASGQAGEGSEY